MLVNTLKQDKILVDFSVEAKRVAKCPFEPHEERTPHTPSAFVYNDVITAIQTFIYIVPRARVGRHQEGFELHTEANIECVLEDIQAIGKKMGKK